MFRRMGLGKLWTLSVILSLASFGCCSSGNAFIVAGEIGENASVIKDDYDAGLYDSVESEKRSKDLEQISVQMKSVGKTECASSSRVQGIFSGSLVVFESVRADIQEGRFKRDDLDDSSKQFSTKNIRELVDQTIESIQEVLKSQ